MAPMWVSEASVAWEMGAAGYGCWRGTAAARRCLALMNAAWRGGVQRIFPFPLVASVRGCRSLAMPGRPEAGKASFAFLTNARVLGIFYHIRPKVSIRHLFVSFHLAPNPPCIRTLTREQGAPPAWPERYPPDFPFFPFAMSWSFPP